MATKNPHRLDGKLYDLRIADVAEQSGRGERWVYTHAAALGGVKKAWDGDKRQTIRFPSVGLAKRLKGLGITANG